MKVTAGNQTFYLDGILKKNLDIVKTQINHKDMDMVGIFDGFEGVGKSVMAMQAGFYVDPSLDLKRICFTPDEFKEAVMKAKKGQCVIYDEAITGAFSREAIQLMNVVLIKMMAQIRQKNLFMLLVLPSFFDLDKNLAIWRAKFLIHCHFGEKYERGFFKFANLEKKKKIYVEGQKLYKYPRKGDPYGWNFYGRFSKHYVVNEAKYRAKKAKSLTESDYDSISLRKLRAQRDSLILVLLNMGYVQEDVAEFSDLLNEGITRKQISNVSLKYRKLEVAKQITKLKSIYEKVGGKVEEKTPKDEQKNQ